MASILKFLKTIRNHWKKTTFAGCAIAYGANRAKESYEIQNLMEKYCQEAQIYGMQPLQATEKPRKILVILNPTANRRKAIKQFEQYCVPILHLAGICVDVIQTKTEGHARTILEEHTDRTDAIVIAGGDGTISESITGILRRKDNNILLDTCPIGVLPLGKENSFAQSLFSNENTSGTVNYVRRLADASMAIVKEQTKPTNVIKIEIMPEDNQEHVTQTNKPVFALSGVLWGSYRDAHSMLDKYWYFGPFRKYVTYIFNGYKSNINWDCIANISYTLPCSGCSNCCKELVLQTELTSKKQTQQQNGRWWNSFVQKQNTNINNKYERFNDIINEDCSIIKHKLISTTDFNLSVCNSDIPALKLNLGPVAKNLTYIDFIREGFYSENGDKRRINETINARKIELYPKNINQTHFYSIDNENYEVKPIRVTLLPKLINVFCLN